MKSAILPSLIVVAVLCGSSPAAVRHVPGEYATIQTAINDCGDGDIVVVERGHIHEHVLDTDRRQMRPGGVLEIPVVCEAASQHVRRPGSFCPTGCATHARRAQSPREAHNRQGREKTILHQASHHRNYSPSAAGRQTYLSSPMKRATARRTR